MSEAQSRRRFLQTAAGAAAAFVVAGCTSHKKTARPAPIYPGSPSFGEKIDAGSLDHILATIDTKHEPYYVPEGRAYVSRFPAAHLDAARAYRSARRRSTSNARVTPRASTASASTVTDLPLAAWTSWPQRSTAATSSSTRERSCTECPMARTPPTSSPAARTAFSV